MACNAVIDSYTLESGATLRDIPLAYHTWGTLNESADNVIVIGHSLTSSSDAGDWWARLLGPGRALDTDHYFVICVNAVGSPYGSLSPVSIDRSTGRPYGPSLSQVSVRDIVGLNRALLDELGVQRIAFAIGGSMGGMQALEWSFYGDYVRGIVPIGVGGVHSPWCIANSEAQRQAIYADPAWNDGWYDEKNPPSAGLAVARIMAMISYRSLSSFQERFGRTRAKGAFEVENYLRYHGQKLVNRFDANCYVYLTRLMDTHDVGRGRGGYEEVLRGIQQPALVVSLETDVLYFPEEQHELVKLIPNAHLAVMDHAHGHDTFLIEQDALSEIVRSWREEVIDPHVL